MNKNTILVGLLVITAFIIGMVFFNKNNNQSIDKLKVETRNSVKVNEPTSAPTNKPIISDDVLDAKLKEIDADVNNIDQSFSDQAVDVMSE